MTRSAMMKKLYFFITLLIIFHLSAVAQKHESARPVFIDSAAAVPSAPLARAMRLAPPEDEFKIYNPKRRGINKVVPGKGLPKTKYNKLQEHMGDIPGKSPVFTFTAASSQSTPTDPTGVAGPNHYVNAWNMAFSIFDKQGNRLVPPAALSSIGGEFQNENDGDPIVLYDAFADRYLIMEFSDVEGQDTEASASFLVAVSQGPDPVNSGWYTYRFKTGALPDYPKISVWGDAYYVTTNKNSGTASESQVIYALERDRMLEGETAKVVGFPLPGIKTNGFYSPAGFNGTGMEAPPRGNAPIIFLQDDEWEGVNEDHLKIWLVNMDWNNIMNSTISESQELGAADGVSPFIATFDGGSFTNLSQPNDAPDVDALQAAMMYMTPYRRFADHNSVVMNFVVDVDPSPSEHAGIRWYELRQSHDGGLWQVYQEGTYAPDKHDRFCGSINMDKEGNIALGYTVLDDSPETPVYPSIRYTGRYANDELGKMTVEEQVIAKGQSPDPSSRYGDYAHMTVDAADGLRFWHNAEYFEGVQRINKVGVFKLSPDFDNDVGVIAIVSPQDASLGSSENITVRVRNFGRNAQSGFPVSITVNGGETITEIFTESIPATTSVDFTFSQTFDLSQVNQEYEITSETVLENDQDPSNDPFTGSVRNLPPRDVGVTAIAAPSTGQNLTDSEEVAVTIENFGGEDQQNIPVSYQIGNNLPVNEVFEGSLPVGENASYTFSKTADLSASGRYRITSQTRLENDFNPLNDSKEKSVANLDCIPEGSDCSFGDGISYFELGDILNERIPCGDGYIDFIGYGTDLDRSKGTFSLRVQTYYASGEDEKLSMWIDLNDNGVFDDNEELISSEVIPTADTWYDYEFQLPADADLGQHLLRIRAGDTSFKGDLDDPCSKMEYGTTHDYSVNIIDSTLDIEDFILNDAKLVVLSENQKQFRVVMETNFGEPLRITVHNILGQKMVENEIENKGEGYVYDLDMSYAARGVYLVRVGTRKVGKVKRFIVK